jgi:hypothetical protein
MAERLSFICVKDSIATFAGLSFVGASVCCGSYMVLRHFYGIFGNHVQYPYQSIREEQFALAIVALTMTCLSSLAWAGPVIDFDRYSSPVAAHIRIVAGTLGAFVAYGIAAWMFSGLPLAPRLFFREYNWLTFVFLVSPAATFVTWCASVAAIMTFRHRVP